MSASEHELRHPATLLPAPVDTLHDEGVTRYRVVFEILVPNRIPREEHVALAIGVAGMADFLPDRVYRRDGEEWVRVYDEAGT